MRPYFNCPKQPESHDDAVLNILNYISYAVSVFCQFPALINEFFFLRVVWFSLVMVSNMCI